jgi:hypothetical protein
LFKIQSCPTKTASPTRNRAFQKLRRALRRYWREHETGNVEEAVGDLDGSEVAALRGLTRTPLERRALSKLLGMIQADRLLER